MIAIDTNVLLRYLLQDDRMQSRQASRIIKRSGKALLVDIVLVETLWVLKGRRYGFDREALAKTIYGLMKDSRFVFEDHQAVGKAYRDFSNSKADFADCLIKNKAEGLWPGIDVVTFDRAAARTGK
ncbi:MAG: PIN domain-containing protein [Parahaliea sp.]